MKDCGIQENFIVKTSKFVDEVYTVKKIDSIYVHKKNKEYVLISDIKEIPDEYIEEHAIRKDGNKYLYMFAFPKHDCAFCFDHELDHLPFMMSIELVRQAGIAIGHVIHNIPTEGFTNIMDCINMNIYKFIELDMPLLIVVNDMMLKNKPSRQERMMHCYLYQNKTLCASVDVNASIMKKGIYQRLRTNSRYESIRNTELNKVPTTNLQMLAKRKNY